MKVMLAYDGSEHSKSAVEETAHSMWPADSEFKIVSVVDNSLAPQLSVPKLMESAQSAINEIVLRLKNTLTQAKSVDGEVLRGNPKSELRKRAEDWGSNLLIIGSRGRKGLSRVLLGSVSHSLLLSLSRSVRISRHNKTMDGNPTRILLSLDDSDFSNHVVNSVCARPWPNNTEFLCVTAVQTLTQYLYEVQDSHAVESLEDYHAEQKQLAQQHLEKVAAIIQSKIPSVSVTHQILDGDPREAVVERAKEWQANLIVTGCKGKNWMDRMLIGSVSEAIATWAECSVEVIKK